VAAAPADFSAPTEQPGGGRLASLGYKGGGKPRTTSLFSPVGDTGDADDAAAAGGGGQGGGGGGGRAVPGPRPRLMYDWAGGRDVIREMRAAGVAPTANIWRYVLQACVDSPHCARGESAAAGLVGLLTEMYEQDGLFPRHCDWDDLVDRVAFDAPAMAHLYGDDDRDRDQDRGGGGGFGGGWSKYWGGGGMADMDMGKGKASARAAVNNYGVAGGAGMGGSRRGGVADKEELLFFQLLNSFSPGHQEQYLTKAVSALCQGAGQGDGDGDGQEKAFYILSNLRPYQRAHLAAWHALLASYSSVGDSRKCHSVLQAFEHVTAQDAPISLWLRLIDSFAFEERRFPRAFQVADELLLRHEARFGNYRSITPDAPLLVPFFNRMLEISVLADDAGSFARYFDLLDVFGLEPDLDTLRIVGTQHVRSRRIDQFDDCVDEMLRVIKGEQDAGGALPGLPLPPPGGQGGLGLRPGQNRHYVDSIGTALPAAAAADKDKDNIEKRLATAVAAAGLGAQRWDWSEADRDAAMDSERELRHAWESARRSGLVNQHFPAVLDALVEHDYWGLAEQLITKTRAALDVSCEQLCSRYVSRLAAAGKIEDAVTYAEGCILKEGIAQLADMSTWHALLQQAREHRRPREAQFALEKMLFSLGIAPDVFCWSLLVSTHGDAGRLDDATKALKDMMQYCGEKPPASCWTVLLEAYKARGDPEGCLGLIQSMYRYRPAGSPAAAGARNRIDSGSSGGGSSSNSGSSISLSSDKSWSIGRMFKEFIFREQFDDARSSAFPDVAGGAKAASESGAGAGTHVTPTLLHWYHTIHAFALHRGGRAALAELRRMREGFGVLPSAKCCGVVLWALIGEGEPELLGALLRDMRADGVAVPPEAAKRMEEMYRYDVILAVIEELDAAQAAVNVNNNASTSSKKDSSSSSNSRGSGNKKKGSSNRNKGSSRSSSDIKN
jgi:hypothetical protein